MRYILTFDAKLLKSASSIRGLGLGPRTCRKEEQIK